MRFFSKITFICNGCFVVAVIMRLIENANKQKEDFNGAIKLQPLESTIVVLGYGAILVNITFFIAYVYGLINGKIKQVPLWMLLFNLVFLVVQIYYFFFSNFK